MPRVGFGYDCHRFADGRPLILGGVRVDFPKGLAAHSDGDVVLHALADAILGAMAQGDIGQNFPDSDPQWRRAASTVFVQRARELAYQQGFRVENCDVTILAETPRLEPYKASMAARISEILDISASRVSVKAKTSEQMGFVGRGEGIACWAVVLLVERKG